MPRPVSSTERSRMLPVGLGISVRGGRTVRARRVPDTRGRTCPGVRLAQMLSHVACVRILQEWEHRRFPPTRSTCGCWGGGEGGSHEKPQIKESHTTGNGDCRIPIQICVQKHGSAKNTPDPVGCLNRNRVFKNISEANGHRI